MLDFERSVTATLMNQPDERVRVEVEAFVAGSLDAMPEHLRLGVIVQSIGLSFWCKVRSDRDIAGLVRRLDRSRVPLLRQYVRLFRSLVLFAEQERLGQNA